MRLLTKEWYQTMGDSGLGVMAQVDARAAESREELFQLLRAEKLEQWLRDRKEVCEVTGESFIPEREQRLFEESIARELRCYQDRLPPAIRAKVADLRVLALGYCTEEVFSDLDAYRTRCEEQTVQTMRQAWDLQVSQGLGQHWTGEHSLHDSVVLAMGREGEDLVIEFCREDVQWPEIRAIRFREGRIRKQEQSPENAWWLYDEIWQTEEGYEVHALLWRDEEVFELTIGCRDTELVWTMPPKEETGFPIS